MDKETCTSFRSEYSSFRLTSGLFGDPLRLLTPVDSETFVSSPQVHPEFSPRLWNDLAKNVSVRPDGTRIATWRLSNTPQVISHGLLGESRQYRGSCAFGYQINQKGKAYDSNPQRRFRRTLRCD